MVRSVASAVTEAPTAVGAVIAAYTKFQWFRTVVQTLFSGLVAYVREVAGRTEQYWCPIKHARRILGAHERYNRFSDYGDAEAYHRELDELRADLARKRDGTTQDPPAGAG